MIGAKDFAGWLTVTAEASGWLVHGTDPSANGFPTLLAVRGSEVVAVLVKPKGKDPTDAQMEWIAGFGRTSIEAIVYTPSDMGTAYERLTRNGAHA